jgi:diguanylate cyclase (GGDEF)-like protein/PAS domain S-box-containing protein
LIHSKKLPEQWLPSKAKMASLVLRCAVYAGTATFLLKHFSGAAGECPIWIPSGIGLGFLLLYGWRYWPVIFIGATLGEFGGGHTLYMSVCLATGALLGNIVAYAMLKIARFDRELSTLKDFILLVVISAFAAIVSTSINIEFLKIEDLLVGDLFQIYSKWYTGDFFGMAFFTPVLLILSQPLFSGWSIQKKTIFGIALLAMFFVGQMFFFGWFSEVIGNISSRAGLVFFPMILFGYYFGRSGAIILFAMILLQATLSTIYGNGFFGPEMYGIPGSMYIWTYLAIMLTTGLIVSLVINRFNIKNQLLKESADAVLKTEGYFKEMVNKTPVLIAAFDSSLIKLDFVNPYFTDVLGYSKTDLIKNDNFWTMAFPNLASNKIDLKQIWKSPNQTQDYSDVNFLVESDVVCKDGALKTIAWGYFVTEKNIVVYGQDITDQNNSKKILSVTSAVYKTMGEAVVIQDADNRILVVNEAFCRLTNYSEAELIGHSFYNFFVFPKLENSVFTEISALLENLGRWEGEVAVIAKDGTHIPRFITLHSSPNDLGATPQIIALVSEVTNFRKAQELIFQQANYDSLTLLPNRRLLIELLSKSIQDAKKKKQITAVIYLDIDNFKSFNDSRGHDFGDELLLAFSIRLKEVIRACDVVARMGGDEFVILLNNLDGVESIDPIVRGISISLIEPISVNGSLIYTTSSLGISVFPDHADNPKSLLLAADQAMYTAKSVGRNNYQFFSSMLKDDASYRAGMLTELRLALESNQFEMYYQPIFNLETNAIAHVEALLRWRRKNGELVLPSNFINESEESGLIIELGDWVMKEVVALMSLIKPKPSFSVAINISAMQLSSAQHSALHWLDLIKSSGLSPELFTFEITERIMLVKSERVLGKIALLQAEGCKFSIDDFGVGYSSLGTIKNFSFDYIKIDGGFISKIGQKGPDSYMVAAIIAMAGALNIKTIAEGVETAEQANAVKQMGCSYAQGYYYAEPMPEHQLRQLLG